MVDGAPPDVSEHCLLSARTPEGLWLAVLQTFADRCIPSTWAPEGPLLWGLAQALLAQHKDKNKTLHCAEGCRSVSSSTRARVLRGMQSRHMHGWCGTCLTKSVVHTKTGNILHFKTDVVCKRVRTCISQTRSYQKARTPRIV